jgi:hypothetical protein
MLLPLRPLLLQNGHYSHLMFATMMVFELPCRLSLSSLLRAHERTQREPSAGVLHHARMRAHHVSLLSRKGMCWCSAPSLNRLMQSASTSNDVLMRTDSWKRRPVAPGRAATVGARGRATAARRQMLTRLALSLGAGEIHEVQLRHLGHRLARRRGWSCQRAPPRAHGAAQRTASSGVFLVCVTVMAKMVCARLLVLFMLVLAMVRTASPSCINLRHSRTPSATHSRACYVPSARRAGQCGHLSICSYEVTALVERPST